jgi:hypothetical protein
MEILPIADAASMAAGYNRGMHRSDAKYKIYLHQDVFIVHQRFLYELLRLFEKQEIGMIGMIGSPKLPQNAVMWGGRERVGKIYGYKNNILHATEFVPGEINGAYCEVEAVDGLLIATQYDVEWREDLFDGWDFYDISQSAEFRKRGYLIVVPNQKEPWCLHDTATTHLIHYNCARNLFRKEYLRKEDADPEFGSLDRIAAKCRKAIMAQNQNDVLLLEGIHEYREAYHSVRSALEQLPEYGIILLNDCMPYTEEMGRRSNTWKTIAALRTFHNNVRVFTLNVDFGCAVIVKAGAESIIDLTWEQIDLLTYQDYQCHFEEYLNWKTEEYFDIFLDFWKKHPANPVRNEVK